MAELYLHFSNFAAADKRQCFKHVKTLRGTAMTKINNGSDLCIKTYPKFTTGFKGSDTLESFLSKVTFERKLARVS